MLPSNPSFNTIGVIVGRDLVGDALIKLPFLRALRNAFPQARICWITSQGPTAYGGALRAATQGLIDEVYETPDWLKVHGDKISKPWVQNPAQNPAPHFDLLIDTRNRWKEARLARKVPHKLFLAPAMGYLFSDRRPEFFESKPPHLCDQLLRLVELASDTKPVSTGALLVDDFLKAQARTLLPEGKTYVGIAPGAGNPVKIWPRYKFEKLGIQQAAKGRVPVFILGPQELSWYDELLANVPTRNSRCRIRLAGAKIS